MEHYESEKEQVEAIKKWWKENGTALILGLTIGLGGLFGWRYWTDSKISAAEQASVSYELLLNALQNTEYDEAINIGERIMVDHIESSYSILTALLLAKVSIEQQNLDGAKTKLRWAIEHAETTQLKQISAARLALVFMADNDPAAAWQELVAAGVTEEDAFYDIKGDVLAARGQIEQAREMYLKALAKAEADSVDSGATQLKFDNLADNAAE